MRDRPFLSASEAARPFGDVVAERDMLDPERALAALRRRNALAEIARLEGEALDAADPDERKRHQCEAEEVRCALEHSAR